MSHKGWRRSIYTAWAEAAHITIASLKGLMRFFSYSFIYYFPPCPLYWRGGRGGDVFCFAYRDDRKIP